MSNFLVIQEAYRDDRRSLTLRLFTLEVTDETDVCLHSIKGFELQTIFQDFHRLVQ